MTKQRHCVIQLHLNRFSPACVLELIVKSLRTTIPNAPIRVTDIESHLDFDVFRH